MFSAKNRTGGSIVGTHCCATVRREVIIGTQLWKSDLRPD
jgi:hypothetical protein